MRYMVERVGFAQDAPIAVVDMYNHLCGGHVVMKMFGQDIEGAQEYADVLNTVDDSKYPDRQHEKYVEEAYSDYFIKRR